VNQLTTPSIRDGLDQVIKFLAHQTINRVKLTFF